MLGTKIYGRTVYAYVTVIKENSTNENLKYADGYIDANTFQWETVANVSERELSELKNSERIHIFVRKVANEDGIQLPFTYVGTGQMKYIEGSKKANGAHLFRIPIVNGSDLIREAEELPHWWIENPARRDVLFYTEEADPGMMKERIERMPLHQEIVHFGKMAVFWGKLDEAEFLKSAYHKLLIKEAFYPLITIRNGNTFDKMVRLCRERVSETV